MLEFGAAVPVAQGVGCVLPIDAKKPGMVGVHSAKLVRLVAVEYEPSLHGIAAAAPSMQYEPGVHGLHASWPYSSWNEPAAHLTHAPMLALGAIVPGLQAVGSLLPASA